MLFLIGTSRQAKFLGKIGFDEIFFLNNFLQYNFTRGEEEVGHVPSMCAGVAFDVRHCSGPTRLMIS